MNTSIPPSKDYAIRYALENNWELAYRENKKLFKENPYDLDTLNRLAYSLVKLGKIKNAREVYQKVLKIDKTNPIALKNLRRIETISKKTLIGLGQFSASANLQNAFIEEAGKTKTLELKNVADKKTLSMLQPGDIVTLAVKRSKVFVQMSDKTYIGMLPDSIGMRMITFMNGGNEYSAFIKALGDKSVTVFIRETKKMARFKNQPSFIHVPLTLTGPDKQATS